MQQLLAEDPAAHQRMIGRGGDLFYHAPTAIIIASAKATGRFGEDLDVGIASENIVLAAASMGINSCIVGMIRMPFDAEPSLAAEIGVPEGFEVRLGVLLGYEAGEPRTPHALDETKVIWN
jgi:nitroreductase